MMTGIALAPRNADGHEVHTDRMAAFSRTGRKVAVVGQGFDGVTLALRAARAGHSVVGIDSDVSRIDELVAGRSPVPGVSDETLRGALLACRYLPTTDYALAAGFHTAVVTLPRKHSSDVTNLDFLRSAARSLAPHLRRGATVLVKCGEHPDVVRRVIVPFLESGSGLRDERDFAVVVDGRSTLAVDAFLRTLAGSPLPGPRDHRAARAAGPELDRGRRRPAPPVMAMPSLTEPPTQVIRTLSSPEPTEVLATLPAPVRTSRIPTPSPRIPAPVRREPGRHRPETRRDVATVRVIVPAYNEEHGIASTIEGLLNQRTPDWLKITDIVIVVNNCKDRTAEFARRYPVTVLEMLYNKHKKAGAMNFGWASCPRDSEYVLTMDADTVLLPDTVAAMARELVDDETLGGVCARYWAKEGRGLLWRLQRLEYARYDDMRELRGWRVNVVSGAAAMYRQVALQQAADLRGRPEPWDNESLIEDYALTLDLKTNGWRIGAARDAHVYTEAPTTWRGLWRQRLRWGRGGMDECLKRGWTPATRRDILAYGLFALSIFFRTLFISMITLMLLYDVPLRYTLIGLVPVAVMWAERLTSAWRLRGRTFRDVLVVAVIVVEDFYGFFLELCAVAAVTRCLRGKRQAW